MAALWRALHRDPDRVRATIFGTFDGATSSFGVTFAMFAQHRRPVEFVAPVVGLAIASAAGMGGGEAASGGLSSMLGRSVIMALTTAFGVLLVALPFFLLQGGPALGLSLALALGLGVVIAERRKQDLGRPRAYAVTFGILAAAIGITSAVAVILPGSSG